ncbi:MAG: hypothetical protein Q7R30_19180 [Acidobacteriota bacterium]|nr:hypothetical protein [Acidobacteriota bacterium]
MRFNIALLLFALVVAGSSPHAQSGIKETVKLNLLGSRLIEITDPEVLALSNVFSGTFITSTAEAPDAAWPRVAVVFDVQFPGRIKTGAYVVHFCMDPATGDGFIYLPGLGENSYRSNIGTIIRDEQDGRWHRASSEWTSAISAHLIR